MRNLIEMNRKHLAHMQATNEKHKLLVEKREEFLRQTKHAHLHMNSVKILSTIISNSRASYSQRIIDSITNSLTNCLDVILQDKKYDIDIEICWLTRAERGCRLTSWKAICLIKF